MEQADLIQFSSPKISELTVQNCESRAATSPGNNPFDALLYKIENEAENSFIDLGNKSQISDDFFDIGNQNVNLLGTEFLTSQLDLVCGKESLGILKLESLSDSLITNNSDFSLNTAFVYQANNETKFKVSDCTGLSRLNSDSLDGSLPSKIYSIDKSRNFDFLSYSQSVLDCGFLYNSVEAIKQRSHSDCSEVRKQDRQRILSLPEFNTIEEEILDEYFNESVFIEARHFANKLAEESINEEDPIDGDLLDNTNPPEFNDISEDESEIKTDITTLFKKIDRMLPQEAKSDDKLSPLNAAFIVDSEGEVLPKEYQSCDTNQDSSSSSSKSKEANKILQNLSIIFNSNRKDHNKKIKGHQLLSSLAHILCSDDSNNSFSNKQDASDDSGHSSIELVEEQGYGEPLDLRVAASKSNDNEHILDLSMKAKVPTRRLSQSFSLPNPKIPSGKNISDDLSQQSASSMNSLHREFGKLKPKRVEAHGIKKGPMKAVIPLGIMAKQMGLNCKAISENITPPKMQQATIFKNKKTSTPIQEKQLLPIAQSTPDGTLNIVERNKSVSCSSNISKRKVSCPVSPLAKQSDTSSSKRDSLIPSPKPLQRRHSATELKPSGSISKLKRTYSIGKVTNSSVIGKLKASMTDTLSPATIRSGKTLGLHNEKEKKNSQLKGSSFMASKLKLLKIGSTKKSLGKENIA